MNRRSFLQFGAMAMAGAAVGALSARESHLSHAPDLGPPPPPKREVEHTTLRFHRNAFVIASAGLLEPGDIVSIGGETMRITSVERSDQGSIYLKF